jgi:phage gpG-like protein
MIQIKIDDNEIKNKINQIKNNKKLIINKIASILEAETIRLFNLQQDPYGNKWKPIKINTKRKNSSKVLIDTGTLRSSIKANFISENTIRLGVVGDLIYSRVHQFGSVITPKTAKALTIPINKESRYLSANEIRSRYKTFIRKNIIFGVKGRTIIPLYLLLKKVEIPRRAYLPDKGLPQKYKELILKVIEKII